MGLRSPREVSINKTKILVYNKLNKQNINKEERVGKLEIVATTYFFLRFNAS